MVTISQRRLHVPSGLHLRRALSRSARALRNLHNEQVYAWDRYFRAGLPRQPRR